MDEKNAIDFVITWVDDTDPLWREKKRLYTTGDSGGDDAPARYRDWDTLRYWFRGVEKFAPWVRYVWFVTDDQKPDWLDPDHPKLKWVRHTDFIAPEYLPTFNSHTIEWNLHRIEGLAEQFVYFNDDMFLIRPARPEDFFVNGLPCDRAELEAVYPGGFFSHLRFNNASVLNRHFSMGQTLRRHGRKWLAYASAKGVLKLLWYGAKDVIPGCRSEHIHIPYRKGEFETLWQREGERIRQTCRNRQRSMHDITPWCIREWRYFTGEFCPRPPLGRAFSTAALETNGALEYLRNQRGTVICLNDSQDEKDFPGHKRQVIAAFRSLLPEPSSFERQSRVE